MPWAFLDEEDVLGEGLEVRNLPLVETPDGILAFDFDGTLHSPEHQPPVDIRLLEWIEHLREKRSMIWGICTGRSMMHLMEGMSGSLPFFPDFAVTREREIYFPNRFGRFVPDERWNRRCDKDHKRLFKKLRRELKVIREYVEQTAKGRWVEVEGDLAGVVLPNEEEMPGLLEEIARVCVGCENLGFERNSIYLRFSHTAYGKGPALKEIAHRMGIPSDKMVVGGDNYNDLTMLTSEITSWPVCPGNAVSEVKEKVREIGGVIGTSEASAGLVEALEEIYLTK